jgi:hypothetical protein
VLLCCVVAVVLNLVLNLPMLTPRQLQNKAALLGISELRPTSDGDQGSENLQ